MEQIRKTKDWWEKRYLALVNYDESPDNQDEFDRAVKWAQGEVDIDEFGNLMSKTEEPPEPTEPPPEIDEIDLPPVIPHHPLTMKDRRIT